MVKTIWKLILSPQLCITCEVPKYVLCSVTDIVNDSNRGPGRRQEPRHQFFPFDSELLLLLSPCNPFILTVFL